MSEAFQVTGTNTKAPFKLKIHRGDGMALIAMNWKRTPPPDNFVGFAIEYQEPEGNVFFSLKNRLSFPGAASDANRFSTLRSPIQKFRWVHFPRNAELAGLFTYRVTPVFMNEQDELSYGEPQTAQIELRRETYPKKLNVTFTRGFVSSQAFVDRFGADAVPQLLPPKALGSLEFVPTHRSAEKALAWMGFEARHAVLEVLDQALADPKAMVMTIAYDLNEPEFVSRLEQLGPRLRVIIDDDGTHGRSNAPETIAAQRLIQSAGSDQVKRQHMGQLQHNKLIVVNGPKVKAAVCGSTNFSWRGFFVQNNNALIVRGAKAIKPFAAAFESYWENGTPAAFGATASAGWTELGISGVNASVAFSPHSRSNAVLQSIADDVRDQTTSSLFYSLAFLFQTPGAMRDAIQSVTNDGNVFVCGISDREVGGLDVQEPSGNVAPVFPAALTKGNVPQPFKSEPTGGGGTRMHHKFLVVDFDKPTARVYLGSYNFSAAADTKNGENLLLVKDRRIAVSYTIEALRMFDHYQFRVSQAKADQARKSLALAKPPRAAGDEPWFRRHYTQPHQIRDRELFSR